MLVFTHFIHVTDAGDSTVHDMYTDSEGFAGDPARSRISGGPSEARRIVTTAMISFLAD